MDQVHEKIPIHPAQTVIPLKTYFCSCILKIYFTWEKNGLIIISF